MKLIGNYKDWIDPKWIEIVLSTDGKPRPLDWNLQKEDSIETKAYGVTKDYFPNDIIQWWLYDEQDMNVKITPPWCKNEFNWWFVKYTPGQFIPLHRDSDFLEYECHRYWIALQDYEPGHVFIYGEQGDLLKDYKVGDVFKFENSAVLHGAANVSPNTRVVFQVAEVI